MNLELRRAEALRQAEEDGEEQEAGRAHQRSRSAEDVLAGSFLLKPVVRPSKK